MKREDSYIVQTFDKQFGQYQSSFEDIQADVGARHPHYALTETQYFGFSVPEEAIHAFLYYWYHPNLQVVSGGAIVFQGHKQACLAAELCDYRHYLPAAHLNGSGTHYRLDNGFALEMLERGHAFRASYDDPSRANRFDVVMTGISDPVMWPSNRHFEHVMHITGELVLRGKRHAIDNLGIRDRSWGEARLEDPRAGPPISWCTGVLGRDFAFTIACSDHPDLNPIWKDTFAVVPEEVDKFGWMIVDGERLVVERTRKITRYTSDTLMPDEVEMEVFAAGRTFHLKGKVIASAPWSPWLNVRAPLCLVRWECGDRAGHGEIQEPQWTDFLHAHLP